MRVLTPSDTSFSLFNYSSSEKVPKEAVLCSLTEGEFEMTHQGLGEETEDYTIEELQVELTEESYTRLLGLVQFGGDREQEQGEEVLEEDGGREEIVSCLSCFSENYTLPARSSRSGRATGWTTDRLGW